MAHQEYGEAHIGLHMAQRLGECLGKGAFGSVYKAFNWGTGEAVAIKQIKLGDLPRSELRMIEVLGTSN
jgi:serine/threonine protein kinase